jgi:hypothetical protein
LEQKDEKSFGEKTAIEREINKKRQKHQNDNNNKKNNKKKKKKRFYNEVSLHRKERNNCSSIHLFFSLGGVDPFFSYF